MTASEFDVGPRLSLVETVRQVRAAVTTARNHGRTIGFVPTMGALHAGHRSLIEAARRNGDFTIVSIYVNPTQFGPDEDFDAYPRTLDADRDSCERVGVNLLFVPIHDEVYPPGDQTHIRPGPLAETLCGPFRPGHFEGVCTVVAKLFNIVQPDVAYFGQKDGQQAGIIRRMVDDLRMPVRIVTCPTVREPGGLAMSSRNAHLPPDDRRRALCLHQALSKGQARLLGGERSIERIQDEMRSLVEATPGVEADYLEIVDADTLRKPAAVTGRLMIAGAIRIGSTRLIDNILVDLPASGE